MLCHLRSLLMSFMQVFMSEKWCAHLGKRRSLNLDNAISCCNPISDSPSLTLVHGVESHCLGRKRRELNRNKVKEREHGVSRSEQRLNRNRKMHIEINKVSVVIGVGVAA